MARLPALFPSLRTPLVIAWATLCLCLSASPLHADERVDGILNSWVEGAANVEPPSLATARARFGSELSAHQLEAAVSLWAPSSVAELNDKFEWSIEAANREGATLTGTPRDEVDRAFIGVVIVRWSSELQRPTSIEFAGIDTPVQFATIRRAPAPEVSQVAFYQSAAESSASAIADRRSEVRTASAVIGDSLSRIELPSQAADVDEILDRWAAASATDGPWQIEGGYFTYDESFAVETRSYIMLRGDGAGTFETRYDPMEVEPGTVNEHKRSSSGEPFEVRPDVASATVIAPEFTLIADPVAQTLHRIDNAVFEEYEWFKHPLREPGWPSLIRTIDADELREQFHWTVTRRTEDEIWLQATPANADVALCVSNVEVILAADDFRPTAIRDFRGGNEQVVVIRQRSTPAGLTSEIMLSGYEGYSEGPTKGEPGDVSQE